MRIKRVNADHPRPITALSDKANSHLRAPGGLVVLTGNAWTTKVIDIGVKLNRVDLLLVFQPVFVVMPKSLVRGRMVAPMENSIPVICAHLVVFGSSKVQLAYQSTVVASLGQPFRNQFLMQGKICVSITVNMVRRWITASQKAGTCRCANGTLCICPIKGHT